MIKCLAGVNRTKLSFFHFEVGQKRNLTFSSWLNPTLRLLWKPVTRLHHVSACARPIRDDVGPSCPRMRTVRGAGAADRAGSASADIPPSDSLRRGNGPGLHGNGSTAGGVPGPYVAALPSGPHPAHLHQNPAPSPDRGSAERSEPACQFTDWCQGSPRPLTFRWG